MYVLPNERLYCSQRGKRPGQVGMDAAPSKLVTWINPDVWQRPSYSLFKSLLNNYNLYVPG